MKEMKLIAAMGAILILTAAQADDKKVKKEFEAMQPKAERAFAKKDAAWLIGGLDDKFMWKHVGRPDENKKQTETGLKMWFKSAGKITCKMSVKDFKVSGDTVTMVSATTMSSKMKPGKDKKSHMMKYTMSMKETWVKTKAGWRATMFEDMPGVKMWMDGKPVDPAKAMGGG